MVSDEVLIARRWSNEKGLVTSRGTAPEKALTAPGHGSRVEEECQ